MQHLISSTTYVGHHYNRRQAWKKIVEVDFFELSDGDECDSDGFYYKKPSSASAESLLENNRIDIVVDSSKKYGLVITSKMDKWTLFPFVFYFDCSDFSISRRSTLWLPRNSLTEA